jgi:hypothetical protein
MLSVALTMLLTTSTYGQTESEGYVWGDAAGVLHKVSRLEDLPEPFLSLHRDQKRQKSRLIRVTGAQAPSGSQAEVARAMWQQRVRDARSALLSATINYAALTERLDNLQSNPILRLTPAVQAEIAAGSQALGTAKEAFVAARKYMVETLPDQARKQRIPAMWLNP